MMNMDAIAANGLPGTYYGQPAPMGVYDYPGFDSGPVDAAPAVAAAPGMIGDLTPVYALLLVGVLMLGVRVWLENQGASVA